MAKKTKKGKNRLDKYYHLAKEQGYRSRAAFKLIQLNRKYNFLKKSECVLDLCAAPGGWMQVAAKNMPASSLILGVDLVAIKPIPGARSIIGDITTQECRADIKRELKGRKMDVVLHDGAPNVGGAWANEAYTQSSLVLDSLKLATEFLAPKGVFVTKIFRSKDYNALLYAFNQLFEKVEATKPAASRNTSAEIFVVCLGYKAPAKIDPRLLDSRILFQDITEVKKVMGPEALLRQKIKQRRFREGYEEGLSTMHKEASALSFVVSDSPVEMLGNFTKFMLDGPGSWVPIEGIQDPKDLACRIRDFKGTDAEIRVLCQDLQVLGRSEFKALLKWRLALRKALKDDLGAFTESDAARKKAAGSGKKDKDAEEDGEEEGEAEEEEDSETKLLKEMSELKSKVDKQAKKEKKKRREMKIKAKLRAAQLAQGGGVGEDTISIDADEMFGLSMIRGKAGLKAVLGQPMPSAEDMELLDADSDDEMSGDDESSSDGDMDDDMKYEIQLEESMEHSYKEYLERKGVRAAAAKEKRKRLGMSGELDDSEEEEGGGASKGEKGDGDDDDVLQLPSEEDEEDVEEGAGLIKTFDKSKVGVAKGNKAMAEQWYKNSVFDDPNLLSDDEDGGEGEEEEGEDEKEEEEEEVGGEKAQVENPTSKKRSSNEITASKELLSRKDNEKDDKEEEEEGPKRAKKMRLASGNISSATTNGSVDDFEVVAQKDASSDSESEDEFDLLDDHGKAEVLALAKRMLHRRDRESIMDSAYNRFCFHDDNLPSWFEDEEHRFMRAIPPVTKAEVEAEKARLQAIDARPIKKIAEAKARKKMKLAKRLDQARSKANSIADQEDLPAKSKIKEIEKLYAKARGGVVKGGKKGGKKGGGKGRGPPLDPRLRKDKKAQKRAQQKMKKGGRKGKK
eukprot:CAMPEP_0175047888 /NCGR_PEP_ID=MMETSP0052_2-20121109/5861_1 /TAXON_ID=51329 ORGANISM="Polytomella parva, Strain SAG 63-3" /NCGR_SAMPLE_ID=MMETSP0052_2 /ASSEMBLY_ACC=CAM_ASM_000194 /LENGTH=905 /DNA_ID=CAMNT_0016311845 /DNA_START=19 /DNA_END=2736 /DNA_ORIENTATION=+